MVDVSISSHADLQALQHRSDGRMFLKLVSLESVHIASHSYELLRNLIEQRRYWRCPQIDLLSLVAGVALELHEMHDLLPLLQEATLEGGFLKALLLKDSAVTLVSLAKDAKDEECVGSLVEKDGLLCKVETLGAIVDGFFRQVMDGTRNFAWLQGRVPVLLDLVNALLSTPVHFPDPE